VWGAVVVVVAAAAAVVVAAVVVAEIEATLAASDGAVHLEAVVAVAGAWRRRRRGERRVARTLWRKVH